MRAASAHVAMRYAVEFHDRHAVLLLLLLGRQHAFVRFVVAAAQCVKSRRGGSRHAHPARVERNAFVEELGILVDAEHRDVAAVGVSYQYQFFPVDVGFQCLERVYGEHDVLLAALPVRPAGYGEVAARQRHLRVVGSFVMYAYHVVSLFCQIAVQIGVLHVGLRVLVLVVAVAENDYTRVAVGSRWRVHRNRNDPRPQRIVQANRIFGLCECAECE